MVCGWRGCSGCSGAGRGAKRVDDVVAVREGSGEGKGRRPWFGSALRATQPDALPHDKCDRCVALVVLMTSTSPLSLRPSLPALQRALTIREAQRVLSVFNGGGAGGAGVVDQSVLANERLRKRYADIVHGGAAGGEGAGEEAGGAAGKKGER